MPPKTVECSICHPTVTKASTLEVAPGRRACRTHGGVEADAEKTQQAAKEAERLRAEAAEKARRPWMHGTPERMADLTREREEFRVWAEDHCWTCGSGGIGLQEYFLRLMVTNKKLELMGKISLLEPPAEVRRLMGNPTVLALLPYDRDKDLRLLRDVVKDRLKQVVPFIGCLRVCGDCIEKYRLKDRLEALLPHPTMDQIYEVMPFVHTLDPLLTALATEGRMVDLSHEENP